MCRQKKQICWRCGGRRDRERNKLLQILQQTYEHTENGWPETFKSDLKQIPLSVTSQVIVKNLCSESWEEE